jgi:hypothetical protein
VESTSRTGTRAIVYNLTVDDAHEYFANGILVSNCDALLYSWRDHTAYMHGPADERTDKLPGESGYESYLEQLEVERFNESRNGWMHR